MCHHLLLLCMLVIQCVARAADFRRDASRYACQCSDVINLVCGTDGRTYTNFCYLECKAVHTPGLTLLKKGYCMNEDTCYCPLLWEPVCGSDGVTYPSLCDLNCAARFNNYLRIVHNGKCYAKSTAEEEHYEEEDHVEGDYEKEDYVEEDYEKEDYVEEEGMGTNANSLLTGLPCSDYVDEKGRCRTMMCSFEGTDPLCGNNGVTYQNTCFFCCAYKKNPDFKIIRRGKCTVRMNGGVQQKDTVRSVHQPLLDD